MGSRNEEVSIFPARKGWATSLCCQISIKKWQSMLTQCVEFVNLCWEMFFRARFWLEQMMGICLKLLRREAAHK